MPKLTHLYLNNLPSSLATHLYSYLVRDGNFERLETLHIRNIGAHSKSLDLRALISMANVTQTLNMRSLDISHNAYDYDLNEAFFGQHKLQRLESLCAANNSFRTCSSKSMEKMFLTQLQCLDLSHNRLSGFECFKAINLMTNLVMLHASHNELKFEAINLNESLLLLSNKPNMTSVDLSHNNLTYFVSYFKLSHAPITMKKLDLSFNQLSLFRFLSLTQVNKTTFANDVLKSVKEEVEDTGRNEILFPPVTIRASKDRFKVFLGLKIEARTGKRLKKKPIAEVETIVDHTFTTPKNSVWGMLNFRMLLDTYIPDRWLVIQGNYGGQ
jgi:hypothetical protein